LSPNPAARPATDRADLQSLDLLFAVCLHALILIVVVMLALWHKPQEFHPQSVQISMISAKQLDQMIKRARAPEPVAKPKEKPKPPVVKAKPKPEPKLQALPKPAPAAAKPKPAARTKPAKDFDPFKPMESSSDVSSSAPKINSKAADVFAGQLSAQEINRYIALIQDAVQRHWKVPTAVKVHDPLVEMILNPDGSVNKVNILESSGNGAFDASLLRAIEAAAPFEVPTREFELFRNNRIRFRPTQ